MAPRNIERPAKVRFGRWDEILAEKEPASFSANTADMILRIALVSSRATAGN
ncbi:MAG: hypothetical protein HZA60_10710 [Deltaproteobacteria bacterium]|nr:hypothetical protein [Deltaproteobacteria bacterium]